MARSVPACQPNSWRAKGRMQAAVLPLPTAPTTATPVNSPAAGSVSQPGCGAGPVSTGWCRSPITSSGSSGSSAGHGGRRPAGCQLPPGPHTRHSARTTEPARNTAAAGATYHHTCSAAWNPGAAAASRSRAGASPLSGHGCQRRRASGARAASSAKASRAFVTDGAPSAHSGAPRAFPQGSIRCERPPFGGASDVLHRRRSLGRKRPAKGGSLATQLSCPTRPTPRRSRAPTPCPANHFRIWPMQHQTASPCNIRLLSMLHGQTPQCALSLPPSRLPAGRCR